MRWWTLCAAGGCVGSEFDRGRLGMEEDTLCDRIVEVHCLFYNEVL